MENAAVSYSFESPRIRRRMARGRWELVCLRKGSDGSSRNLTKLTDIPCSASDGTGERRARADLATWVDELRSLEARRIEREDFNISLSELKRAQRARLELTVEEYGSLFIERRIRRGEIERSTAANWMSDFHRYCLRSLRDGIRICEVTVDDVTDMIGNLIHERGLAKATARRGFFALNQVMKEAMKVDGLPSNPCALIKPPKKAVPRWNPLSVAKTSVLIKTLMEMKMTKTVFSALCALMFGISEGEICALQLKDIDLSDTKSLLVKHAIGRDGSSTYVKVPKTESRRRRIFLTDRMVAVFRARISELERECVLSERELTEEHFIVGRPDGTYWNPRLLSKGWGQLSDTLDLRGLEGLRLSFHDLRHTFATCANAAGLDVSTIAHIMGHSKETVTLMVYISVDPDEAVSALVRMENRFGVEESCQQGSEGGKDLERRVKALGMLGMSNSTYPMEGAALTLL